MKLRDTYRGYDDLRALFFALDHEEFGGTNYEVDEAYEHLSQWLVDNGYEITRYEIDGPDVLDEMERMEAQRKDRGARWDKGEVPIEPIK